MGNKNKTKLNWKFEKKTLKMEESSAWLNWWIVEWNKKCDVIVMCVCVYVSDKKVIETTTTTKIIDFDQ